MASQFILQAKPSSPPSRRFQLSVWRNRERSARIQVIDCHRGREMFDWSGPVASYLLSTGLIESTTGEGVTSSPCSKAQMCHLALLAAAARSLLSSMGAVERLVTDTVFAHPGHHLSCLDVCTLLALEQHVVAKNTVQLGLDALVKRMLVQEIRVDRANVFYDIDTRPHAHVFDAASGQLFDA